MKAHRTLIIKRPLSLFTGEEREALVRVLTRIDALGNLWARGYAIYPPDLDQRFASKFNYFKSEVSFAKQPKVWFARVHAIYDVGLNSHDSQGLIIDLARGILRLRWIIKGRGIAIRLTNSEVKYIRGRLSEGGRAKLARAWVEDGFLYVAIIFERDVQPIQPSNYRLAIDVNSWRNGIVWGLIRDGKVSSIGREVPNLRRIEGIYNKAILLERQYGRLRRLGLADSIEGRRLWRMVRRLRRRLYAYLRDYAQKVAHKLGQKALHYKALVIIDNVPEESRRMLLEDGLDSGLAKLYLAGLKRFVKLLVNQLEWYGIPYRFRRLPSTICPVCQRDLRQLPGRVMVCGYCGFRANRDLVPIIWATRPQAKPGAFSIEPQ